jgi:hypothetical protein
MTVTFLIPWGALSDERTGLSLVCAAGPSQRSLSRVLVPWDLRPYFSVSDLRLLFRRLLRSQGHGGGIRLRLHTSVSLICVCRPLNRVFVSGIEDTFSYSCIFRRNNLVLGNLTFKNC